MTRAAPTRLEATLHAVSEPCGRELARDLRAAQLDLRCHSARQHLACRAIAKREHALVQFASLERSLLAKLQIMANFRFGHAEPAREHACRKLGVASRAGRSMLVIAQQITIARQRNAR